METRLALRLARLGPERANPPSGGGTSSLLGLASSMVREELPAAVVLRTEVSTTEAFESVESNCHDQQCPASPKYETHLHLRPSLQD